MTSDDDRLDDDVAALLRRETADATLPAAHVARARERLELRLGLGAAGAVASGSVASGGVASAPSAGATTQGTSATGEGALAASTKGVSRGLLGVVATTTFVVGIATGWVASRTLASTETSGTRAVPSTVATASDAPARPTVEPTDPIPTNAPSPVAPPSPPSPSSAPTNRLGASSIAVDTSKEERALLDQARRALNEGDGARALALAESHAKHFPRGALAEERDVLRIQALVATGDAERARTAADAFRKKYPASPFLPAVESRLPDP